MAWGSPVERERRARIQIAVAAYAYEVMASPLIDDGVFDIAAACIKPEMSTGNEVMDKFFREEFSPITGSWIHKHPEISGIASIYERLTGKLAKHEHIRKNPR